MLSRSPTPDFSLLNIGEDLAPLPSYKAASTTSTDFSSLLDTLLQLHEDLKSGCGGQLWPAGMVLAKHMLRYHRTDLKEARILELGAGGGLVALGVAIGCQLESPIYVTDQENMLPLMRRNIALNELESRAVPLVLNWGDPLPAEVIAQKPNVVLAADCVYFEPAFPLLLATLEDLLRLSPDVVIYFCFKKRRRASMQFMKRLSKKFLMEEIEDTDRPTFSKEGLFLYTFRRKQ
ncbi:putative methyltransferase-domain-containing protein [Calycina marina]|uniref:Protein-lysine N-methyltransferase EFM6 n=1 Tax=Calycina marina TaxID=1763456 RepID=A0A9P7Z2Z6_9HELO|nr:putative methyltransferase-domain-containing protein [Calycina marina]